MIARKRFGQHFLTDLIVIEQIIRAIAPQSNQHVIEIGPGRGALTQYLIPPIVNQLDLIEIDRDLVKKLRHQYQANPTINIIEQDVLTVDFASMLGQDKMKCRIVGNLPYNISTPLLFHLFSYVEHIEDMYFMVQLEVALRMAAQAGESHYGRLSIMTNYFCDVELLFDVSPDAFSPPPAVMSAVLRLKPRRYPVEVSNLSNFEALVKTAFSQPRKTIKNNFKNKYTFDWEKIQIDPSDRPGNLSIADYVHLANQLSVSSS